MSSNQLYSRHFFLFPFQWFAAHEPAGKQGRTQHVERLVKALDARRWSAFAPPAGSLFSVQHYFHDFACGAVLGNTSDAAVRVFTGKTSGQYKLQVKSAGIGRTESNGPITEFVLEFSALSLRVYETGVAILCLQLDNYENRTKEDVLIINDYARRLFPQYLDTATGVNGPKHNFLPESVSVAGFTEDFSDFPADSNHGKAPVRFLPAYLTGLLGPRFRARDQTKANADLIIENLLDDRMFTVCSLHDEGAMDVLMQPGPSGRETYLNDPFWYAYLFVDKDKPTVAHTGTMEALLQAATYPRWLNDAQLFGVCRYSFVALGGRDRDWIVYPMTGNYLRIIELCLAQRASVLLFREETTRIARELTGKGNSRALSQRIRHLYGDYIGFSNRIYFREVSSYEQGIELYDLMHKQLRVEEQVSALKSELDELNGYAALLHEEERNHALELLSILGGVVLIPGFLLTYWGFLDEWKTNWAAHQDKLEWLLVLCLSAPALIFMSGMLKKQGAPRTLGLVLLILLFIIVLAAPFLI